MTTDTIETLRAQRQALTDEARQLLDHEPRWPRLRWRRHRRWRLRLWELPAEVRSLDDRIAARLAARELFERMRASVETDARVPRGRVAVVLGPRGSLGAATMAASLAVPESPLRAAMRAAEDYARAAVLTGSVFLDTSTTCSVPHVSVDPATRRMVQHLPVPRQGGKTEPPSDTLAQLQAEVDEAARIRLPQRDHPPCPECGGTFVALGGGSAQVRRHMSWCPTLQQNVTLEVDEAESEDFQSFIDHKLREGLRRYVQEQTEPPSPVYPGDLYRDIDGHG